MVYKCYRQDCSRGCRVVDSSSQLLRGGRASRISVSLSDGTLDKLQKVAAKENRSLSNLCALLIESALRNRVDPG